MPPAMNPQQALAQNQSPSTGGDWWTQNAPPSGAQASAGDKNTYKGLGVDPSQSMNDDYIVQQLVQAAKLNGTYVPGESEANAKSYWLPKVKQNGGWSNYWADRALGPAGGGTDNPGGGGGGGGFGAADVMAQDPGYQFARDQAVDAVQKSAAARGTLLTGGTLRDLAGYAGGLASQRYGDIFNRNLQLANLGYDAASRQAGLGSSYGQQAGADLTGYGNAAAAGSINQGNIWGGALSGLGGLYMRPQGGGGTFSGLPGGPGMAPGAPVGGPIPGLPVYQTY